jgi:hypothetical protein
MNAIAIVWVLLVSPAHGQGDAHDVTLGQVFSTRALCLEAWREVPEEGLIGECVRRELWSAKK